MKNHAEMSVVNDNDILAIFEIVYGDAPARFSIRGKYEIKEEKDFDGNVHRIPEFFDLSAAKLVDDKEEDFSPSGHTWGGRKYDVDDMINGFISSCIMGSSAYTKIFLEEGLEKIVSSYLVDERIALSCKELKVPMTVLYGYMLDVYELSLVTDKYIYYCCDGGTLMLDVATHDVISDNYFAENAYFDSVESINEEDGAEAHLWGELPEC